MTRFRMKILLFKLKQCFISWEKVEQICTLTPKITSAFAILVGGQEQARKIIYNGLIYTMHLIPAELLSSISQVQVDLLFRDMVLIVKAHVLLLILRTKRNSKELNFISSLDNM